jgi:hypothetical protein
MSALRTRRWGGGPAVTVCYLTLCDLSDGC